VIPEVEMTHLEKLSFSPLTPDGENYLISLGASFLPLESQFYIVYYPLKQLFSSLTREWLQENNNF
jgi:hypothetical protein